MAHLLADVKEFTEETRVDAPANFLMRIEHFSLLTKYGINKYESRAFDAGGYIWKLIMNFEGNDVSVYFLAENDSLAEGWEVNAIFTFFIHNQLLDYYHCFRGKNRRFNAVSPKWGLSKLISMKNLRDPSKGYVKDDSCVFGAEVFVIKPQRINECLSLVKETAPFTRDWKISGFSKLEDVWNSEEFQVGDHKWKVNLHPKGNASHVRDRYMSVFLECVEAESFDFEEHHKVIAEVNFRIKSHLNNNHLSANFIHWFTSSSPNWGYDKFLAIADMTSKTGLLIDDCCLLEIEITVQAACT